ncbi:hypothetical protein MLD38_009174 [Melastoma candidum]|uniref:Uncharacterized protein n=1 Tax=Melastoma candidum TaxID=119954 RepID=A0ACB9RWN7_9MYRT|nr:hypothetical protein MLD38_009174 [Melastoma candidum]
MSFHLFKEALKPCSNLATAHESLPISQGFDPGILRKPPRSSLSQQLSRLDDSFAFEDWKQRKPGSEEAKKHYVRVELKKEWERRDNGVEEEKEEDEEEEEERVVEFRRGQSSEFRFDHTGPFEPLVLSPEDAFPVIQVPASINCRLLEHQREGVKFLYGLYAKNHGGVLGDDMGLGKTIQTIAFLAAICGKDGESVGSKGSTESRPQRRGPMLIICPTSVILNWESEFSKWSSFMVCVYHGANRELIREKLNAQGVEVLIASFDTYRIHGGVLSDVKWEIVVVDEAHRLKNEKSKLYAACLELKTPRRIGLTGTVMQNKIMELFNLFDWVTPGCLGTREHFREYYDEPLKMGQRSTAPEKFIHVADERKQHLVRILQNYMLRRAKEETIGHLMLGKEDNVVFCAMSELQKRVYKRMLQLPDIQCLINKDLPCGCGSPLTQVQCCKRTVPDGIIWPFLHRDNPEGCDSCPFCIVLPCLIKLQQISNHLELIKPNLKDEPEKQKKDTEFAAAVFADDIDMVGGSRQNENFMGLSDVRNCGKMRALEKLMDSWTSRGDKILLFSYSVRMLDILEKFLIRKGCCFSRLDGSTPASLRQSLVDDFNSSPSKQVFLISTRAGGLGLNLVSANRVVIFDPNWNPAHDLQAQDRSFRFGQRRHVLVFRLLAAGSLEELVYSRQVYKQQLSNIAVSGKMEKRYFEGVQGCKEFQGELFGICNLFRDLSEKLFTSEVVQLNEKSVPLQEATFSSPKDSAELGCGDVPGLSKDFAEGPTATGQNLSNREEDTAGNPNFKDMGIVYAHRNEDIVNGGRGLRFSKATVRHGDTRPQVPDAFKRRDVPSTSEQKRAIFKQIAEFRNMGELEFSRWVLSASVSEREDVLCDYKRRKRKAPLIG